MKLTFQALTTFMSVTECSEFTPPAASTLPKGHLCHNTHLASEPPSLVPLRGQCSYCPHSFTTTRLRLTRPLLWQGQGSFQLVPAPASSGRVQQTWMLCKRKSTRCQCPGDSAGLRFYLLHLKVICIISFFSQIQRSPHCQAEERSRTE